MPYGVSRLRVRMERYAAQAVARVPRGVQNRLAAAGEQHDRSELDPTMRMLLAVADRRKPLHAFPLKKARQQHAALFASLDAESRPVSRLRNHRIGPGGYLLVREYRVRDSATLQPAVMFFHGGGFTLGSVESYECRCRFLADELDIPVFSVDYRLAPEHPFPAWIDDALLAWRWLQDSALDLGIDPHRVGVMGDSAGGNIATVLCQQTRDFDTAMPAAQCLLYPSTDQRMQHPSISRFAEGFGLDRALMDWFRASYLPDAGLEDDARLSPLLATTVDGLPAAVVAICTDPLRDEGLAYAQRLADSGVVVKLLDYPHLVHGFSGMGGAVPAARRAVQDICAQFASLLTR